MSTAKNVTDIFYRTGALHYFAFSSSAEALKAAGETIVSSTYDIATKDPNAFEKFGANAGYTAGVTIGAGIDIGFLKYAFAREGGVDLPSGAISQPSSFRRAASVFAPKSSISGAWNNSLKTMGWKFGLGMMAVQGLAPIALSAAGSFFGRIIDKDLAWTRREQTMQYDNRYFNTERYDMNSYQHIGAAYDSLRNVQVSHARIFFNRG